MCDSCEEKKSSSNISAIIQKIVGNSIPINKQNFVYAVNAQGSKYEKGLFKSTVFAEILDDTTFKYAVLLFFIEGKSKKVQLKGHYHFSAKTEKTTMNKMLKEMASGKFDNSILNFSFFVSENIKKIINIVKNQSKDTATDVTVSPVYLSSSVSTNCGMQCNRSLDCAAGPCYFCAFAEGASTGFQCYNTY